MVPSAVAACSYYVVEKICERKVDLGIPKSTTGKYHGEYGMKLMYLVGLLVASTMLCLSHVVGLFLCVIYWYKIKSPPRED